MTFATPLSHGEDGTVSGPPRLPTQMLGDQEYDGHASVHDGAVADDLGLAGAPIEGPTHFSQFDPLAFDIWGPTWFESGCLSAHFLNMVVAGEAVSASMAAPVDGLARIDAARGDGEPVLTGTASVDADAAERSELRRRLAEFRERDPGELFIVDRIAVGDVATVEAVSIDMTSPNGNLYPFSLRQKLDGITETSAWYETDDNPWGRPVLPFEMFSVLTNKTGNSFPVRGPAVGLFVDLEVRAVSGPLFVGEEYRLEREVLAVGQSRRVESMWVETKVLRAGSGEHAATVLLHSGTFKASYADYPA